MFELTVEREFRARHAVTIAGVPESPHEHHWLVTVVVAGDRLDDDGLLCDFHELERAVDAVIDPFRDADLNVVLDPVNPTAENVAKHIAENIRVPAGVALCSVSVTEAPGCVARMDVSRQRSAGELKADS